MNKGNNSLPSRWKVKWAERHTSRPSYCALPPKQVALLSILLLFAVFQGIQNPHFHELHRDSSLRREYCAPSLASSACSISHPKGMFYQDKNTASQREKPEKFSMARKGWRAERCSNSELGFGYPQPQFLGAMKLELLKETHRVSSETVKTTAASWGLGGLLLPSGGNPKSNRMGKKPFLTTGRGNSKFTHILSSSKLWILRKTRGKSRNNL